MIYPRWLYRGVSTALEWVRAVQTSAAQFRRCGFASCLRSNHYMQKTQLCTAAGICTAMFIPLCCYWPLLLAYDTSCIMNDKGQRGCRGEVFRCLSILMLPLQLQGGRAAGGCKAHISGMARARPAACGRWPEGIGVCIRSTAHGNAFERVKGDFLRGVCGIFMAATAPRSATTFTNLPGR